MSVNTLDKYYTPDYLVKHTIAKAIEIIGMENITEVIEPSSGDGAFIEPLRATFLNIPLRFYDLYPEHPDIIRQDYKALRLSYKKGRLTIGNPPFGVSSSLWKAFCKKAASNSDYIAYISPASQYNSNYYFKEGVLVYSELLNDVEYRGSETEGGKAQKVKTCLNVYKVYNREEDEDWRLNKINSIVKYGRHHRGEENKNYDYYLACMTNGSKTLLRLCEFEKFYITYGVKVLDENYRSKIEEFLNKFYLYAKELQSGSSAPVVNNTFFLNKLKTFLFPTREERLEQDVIIACRKIENQDFYMGKIGSGGIGKIFYNRDHYDPFAIKILNENKRKKIEEFSHNYRTYLKEKGYLNERWTINPDDFKKDLMNYLYGPEDNEFPEVKKPVIIERARFAKELF